jgi:hypothetical protein
MQSPKQDEKRKVKPKSANWVFEVMMNTTHPNPQAPSKSLILYWISSKGGRRWIATFAYARIFTYSKIYHA